VDAAGRATICTSLRSRAGPGGPIGQARYPEVPNAVAAPNAEEKRAGDATCRGRRGMPAAHHQRHPPHNLDRRPRQEIRNVSAESTYLMIQPSAPFSRWTLWHPWQLAPICLAAAMACSA